MTMTTFSSGTPLPVEAIAAPLQPLIRPEAQQAARLRVAKALLPAPPDLLVPALAFLAQDPDPTVRTTARETLQTMPGEVILPVLKDTKNPGVLDALARAMSKHEDALRTVALNPNAADDTVRWLASIGNSTLCDVIGRNQVRALRHPAIIEAIYLNPFASQGVIQALLEIGVRSGLQLDHVPGFREAKALLLGEEVDDEEGGLSEAEFQSALLMASGLGEQVDGKTGEADEKKSANLQALIQKMSVSQKVRLAMVGDGQVRKLLVRDPKKLVALAVLKSPRLTEGEVTMFAALKTLPEELLSTIARNRSWTKDYAVRKALVFNPKTPITFSMSFLRTLTQKDLKDCSTSRDVNQTVGRTAKRMLEAMTDNKKK